MIIKELIEELKKYDKNDEIQISIANKSEDRIEIRKENGKIVISETDRVMIERLEHEIFKLKYDKIDMLRNQINNTCMKWKTTN